MPSREGSRNRNKSFLLNRLKDMYGEDFHPIMKMASNAAAMQNLVDEIERVSDELEPQDKIMAMAHRAKSIGVAIDAWDKVAQYTEPKLKAIEHSSDSESPVMPSVINIVGANASDSSAT